MELNTLYNIATKESIHILNQRLQDIAGMFCNYKNINAIAIDYSKLENSTQEKCVLAEELGHYYYDATYSPLCDDVGMIRRQEYRAKKWAAKALISRSLLEKCKDKNLNSLWEIAEELGVTEDVAAIAVNSYQCC